MQQNPDAKNDDKQLYTFCFVLTFPVLMFFFMYTIWIRSYYRSLFIHFLQMYY